MHQHLAAQLIGFVAVGFSLAVFQVNQRRMMLTLLICAALLYTCSFYMLGAYTGAVMNLLAAIRSYVFIRHPKQQDPKILIIFLIILVVATGLTWQGPRSLLPLVGTASGTVAFWLLNLKRTRLLTLISPPSWFIYNVISGSYPGMFIEIVNLSSNLVGIYRFDIRKHPSK
jgi:hypothetical protein